MDELKEIWQSQEVETMNISVEVLRVQAERFERRIQWRNWREQAACLVAVVTLGAMCLKNSQTVPRIACGMIVAGVIYAAWHLQVRGSVRSLPADMGRANCVAFYRRELERQRDLLRSVWNWYLGPIVPGIALLVIYGAVVAAPGLRWFPVAYATAAAAFFWLVSRMNRQAAEKLDHVIAELERESGMA